MKMAKKERTTRSAELAAVEPLGPPDEAGGGVQHEEAPNPLRLPLGPPFALSNECDLIDRAEGEQLPPNAGCFATVKCNCGALWRANLLSEDDKECPSCHALFTHLLVIVPIEDRGVLPSILEEVMMAHGMVPEIEDAGGGEDDEEEDDAEDAEEEEDDADAEDDK